jgi:hypothetical protein
MRSLVPLVVLLTSLAAAVQPVAAQAPKPPVYLPLLNRNYSAVEKRLCRYGVATGRDIAEYSVSSLRIGWYVDWEAREQPPRPGGMTYPPLIAFGPDGSSYNYWPAGEYLARAVKANPGATWLLGNEPDCIWQDNLRPEVYAQAYHDLYFILKQLDPTAKVANGGIVQPTPLRLQYLDKVLSTYESLYGTPMPIDVWNTHAFVLREASCAAYPDSCWGAEVPPGSNAAHGILYDVDDTDNFTAFKQNVEAMRRWMKAHGYQDRPLIISEFGNNLYPEIISPARVNAYMSQTFDYLRNTVSDTVGYEPDNYRLVQRWAWYSLNDSTLNGWLFDPVSKEPTVWGNRYAEITSAIDAKPNLLVHNVAGVTLRPASPGGPFTMTLRAEVTNNGDLETTYRAKVRFYNGDPALGGTQIGTDQFLDPLDGCATSVEVQTTWQDVLPGSYAIYVVADPDNIIPRINPSDNKGMAIVTVGYPTLMPFLSRDSQNNSLPSARPGNRNVGYR